MAIHLNFIIKWKQTREGARHTGSRSAPDLAWYNILMQGFFLCSLLPEMVRSGLEVAKAALDQTGHTLFTRHRKYR